MSLWDDYEAEIQFYSDFPYDVPGDYWCIKDGTKIKLSDMSESHIRNCMNMVGEDDGWYARFEQELDRRKSTNDEFDFNSAMDLLYPDTEYIINKSAYDCGAEGVREEIIRCKDCKYMDRELDGAPICRQRCWHVGYDYDYVKLDGFCAWAERSKV